MNLLECFIKEIHNEEYKHSDKYNCDYVEVDLTYNCYGTVKRTKEIFGFTEWEKTKEKGYFLG